MTLRRRRAALLALLLLAGIIVSRWIWSHQRQTALNRQLIAALVRLDDRQALVLVNSGADPNTLYEPPPDLSFQELLNHLFHRSPLPTERGTSAFLMACRAFWNDTDVNALSNRPDDPQLVRAMLQHGANMKAKDKDGWTSLIWSVWAEHPKTTRVLLENGADVNARNNDGLSVLDVAVDFSNEPGDVMVKDIIPQLLAHSASPNLAGKTNISIPDLARQYKRPDIAILLRRAGVTK